MENKQQPKKQWTKPELTVLVRNKPEEAVLLACKITAGGPYTENTDCNGLYRCNQNCSSDVGS